MKLGKGHQPYSKDLQLLSPQEKHGVSTMCQALCSALSIPKLTELVQHLRLGRVVYPKSHS